MQKIMISTVLILFSICVLSCKRSQTKQNNISSKAKLEVMYFHGIIRCPACNAVEKNTKKLLDEIYKTQLDNGTIHFASYNFEEATNKALVEKYQISFSTLLIVNNDGNVSDYTNTAFKYALVNPTKFSNLLKEEIDKNLK